MPYSDPFIGARAAALALGLVLDEQYASKDFLSLQQEGVAVLRAVGRHLPWKHYYATLRSLLKLADKLSSHAAGSSEGPSSRERLLFAAICSLLEAWHYDVEAPAPAPAVAATAENKVDEQGARDEKEEEEEEEGEEEEEDGDGVEGGAKASALLLLLLLLLLPLLTTRHPLGAHTLAGALALRLLVRESKDRKGQKQREVRPRVAVAISQLLVMVPASLPADTSIATATTGAGAGAGAKYLQRGMRAGLLSTLVMDIVATLRSRDMAVRQSAREGLEGVLRASGMGVLRPIMYELQQQLREGYMRHVCNYSVRAPLVTALRSNGNKSKDKDKDKDSGADGALGEYTPLPRRRHLHF